MEAAVPKINVYLPDDLAEAVKEADMPVSAICQAALEHAVRRLSMVRQLVGSDLDTDTLANRLPRFTDKARTAFKLAAEQARTTGARLVGTEHLLAGILAEGSNLALPVLHAMDIEAGAVRAELDRAETVSQPDGPDAGRRISGPLGAALVGAAAAANALGHNYIGCEHLLLGLITEPDGAGGQILRGLGADERLARRTVTASLAGVEYWQARAQGQAAQAPASGPTLPGTMASALAEAIKRELQPFADRLASIEQRLSEPTIG
ncbi:MAG TPA: Clp protease N-terminal domain-containing protein [Trebonia sp.]|nr:Clp protease N-terminal domain-containing protein [Trebonia sp.]